MIYNIYGRKFEIIESNQAWKVFILGNDGKKRPVNDFFIPSTVRENGLERYLEDLLHEWAVPGKIRS